MLKLSSDGQKMPFTWKPINRDNAVVNGTPSGDYSIRNSLNDDDDDDKLFIRYGWPTRGV